MLPQEIINQKRKGQSLSQGEIQHFVDGLVDGSWHDAQASALAMAICLNGMTSSERSQLTLAMANSGDRLSWADFDLDGPILDKHSTGGVGDKVSLVVGAIVAAAGGFMPKMSGAGLGHTGGTVDKMAAIPGYNVTPQPEVFRKTVKEVGFALIGQTGRLAPADKRLYGIRDVTGTVESIDLIAASILSKKLAVSPDVLVLDVKAGTGAFMETEAQAIQLAEALVEIGISAGVKTSALVTDMNDVLGQSVGNALEVLEAIDFLKGKSVDPRFKTVCLNVANQLIHRAGLNRQAEEVLSSGEAADRFARMVSWLGGPVNLVDQPEKYLVDKHIQEHLVCAEKSGFVLMEDAKALGLALVELGGGRLHASDLLDTSVGLLMQVSNGQAVETGTPLVKIMHRDGKGLTAAISRIHAGLKIVSEAPTVPNCIIAEVG